MVFKVSIAYKEMDQYYGYWFPVIVEKTEEEKRLEEERRIEEAQKRHKALVSVQEAAAGVQYTEPMKTR